MSSHLDDPRIMNKFRVWLNENALDDDSVAGLDVEAEFGKDLTYDEAIELAVQKFPSLWRAGFRKDSNKVKQIIFVKELVQKISEGKVQVTYRKSPKAGLYYVIANRFKQKPESSRMLIEFYRTDKINAAELTDDEAQLAGVETADEIRSLFEKWYGSPIPPLFRNWFRVYSS